MISVMNRDLELVKKSGGNGESRTEQRVLERAVDSSNYEVSNSRVSDKARASLMELDPGAPESESVSKMFGNGRSAEFRASPSEEMRFLVSSNGEGTGVDMEMKCAGSFVDSENSRADQFEDQVDQFDGSNDQKCTSPQYKSLLSEFDDYVANDKSGAMVAAATSRAMSYGFEVGDMVWGKVKSHPWWPGHIFNEALVSASVRRTRREGHVLVAFFGDSSYGWFDPAELIPFDPNYYEKSRQTNSRTFLKAVEEAVDEGSRRRGLGLACKCRNRYNFRLTNVEGYVAVDVPDFEAGCIYSWNQIRRSRDCFKPSETLSFIKQLALTPRGGDHRSINFLNNKATIFAYRKAVYEEFDETYAQAFGVPAGRPSREAVSSFDQLRGPARAPLSGPLVIAEALGGGKGTIKPMKLKDQSKKDRYLFKRRDELSNLKDVEIHQELPSSAVPLSTESGGAEDYVLLKRTPTVPIKTHVVPQSEPTRFSDSDSDVFSLHMFSNEAEIVQLPVDTNLVSQGHSIAVEASSDKGMIPLGEVKETVAPGEVSNNACSDMPRDRAFPGTLDSESLHENSAYAVGEVRYSETANISDSYASVQQPELSNSVNIESDPEMDQVLESPVIPEPSPSGPKHSDGDSSIGGVMKPKVLKRSAEDLSSGISFIGEKKKKKKKREAGTETSFDHVRKQLVSKKMASLEAKLAGKSKAGASNNLVSHSGRRNDEFDIPQLLSDLQAFALDPFHGIEWNCQAFVQKFFLRFRSLFYQKSLVLSPPSEAESIELRAAKSPDTDNLTEHGRDLLSSNLAKPLFRRDDPTKAGRKRVPSDRLEEIAAKKVKKISDLKLLASEKKVTLKLSDKARESALPPTMKRDTVKKPEASAKKVDPTMLVLRFPPQTSLPSLNELKARFGRFGPIDQSGLRIFWKSSTCRVVFNYKPDAEAAYKYAVGNKSLFGNVNVKYHIREMATEGSEIEKPGGGDDNSGDALRPKDPTTIQGRVSIPTHQPISAGQLKSCLKKTPADESGNTSGGSGKGAARVKFMLGGEESSSKGEQLMMIGNRNNNINANFADDGTVSSTSASSSVGMDINSNFFQKVAPPPPLVPLPPLLPLPTQFTKPSPLSLSTNLHHLENPPPNTAAAAVTTTDISQQMLNLLTRCSDVVTNVTGLLGYVPYHPL